MGKLAAFFFLLLVVAGSLAAEGFQHPSANYRVEIPGRWEKRLASGVLLLSSPDGLRVRVEYELTGESLDEKAVYAAFRTDGRRLKASYGAVRVSRKPERSQEDELGGVPTYRYGIQYKPSSRSVHAAEGYIASGTSLWPSKELQIKMLVYGSRLAFQRSREDLASFLDSFTWPYVAGTQPPPRRPPRVPATTRPDPPPTQVAVAPAEPVDQVEIPVLPTREPSSGGSGGGSEMNFHRGAKTGGSRMFRNAYVCKDEEWNRQVNEAFGPKDRERTEAQQAASAARMGFRE